MKKLTGLLAFACVALINTVQAEGDIETGRELSTQCSACHGAYGMSNSEQWPNIAGQKESYIIKQLESYQSGDRSNATMQAIVGPLDAQNIEDLAAYFASNAAVASFSFETQTLSIPYVSIGDAMYAAEMLLTSPEELSFSVTNLEER